MCGSESVGCVCVCVGVRVWGVKQVQKSGKISLPLSGAMKVASLGNTFTKTESDPSGPISAATLGEYVAPPEKSLIIIKLSVVFTVTGA